MTIPIAAPPLRRVRPDEQLRADVLEYKTSSSRSGSKADLYRRAWIAAMLGFILLVLSYIVQVVYWTRWYSDVYGDYDIGDFRSYVWLGSVAGLLHIIGLLLMIAALIFVIRGLMVDNDRRVSGAILIGTLGTLWLVAVVALALYVVAMPMLVLATLLEAPYLAILYYGNPEFLFLAAMPLIVARALHIRRPFTVHVGGTS